ncbi:MAG: hypothetical protein GXY36_08420 [Chloroflexi bacterium]|nr:hypothetical protein [Chloroflexota bacterium]
MMSRFPLLNTYRILLQIVAGFVVIAGFLSALDNANREVGWGRTEFELGIFLVQLIGVALTAFFLLVLAELIQLGLVLEDHLYHMRTSLQNVASVNPLPTQGPKAENQVGSSAESMTRDDPLQAALVACRQQQYQTAADLFEQVLAEKGQLPVKAGGYYADALRMLGHTEKADHYWQLQQERSSNRPTLTGIVTSNRTLICHAPRATAAPFAVAMQGKSLDLVGRTEDYGWLKIIRDEGEYWVNASDVRVEGDIDALEVE